MFAKYLIIPTYTMIEYESADCVRLKRLRFLG